MMRIIYIYTTKVWWTYGKIYGTMELKFNGLSEFEKKLFLYFISDIEQDNERELKQNVFMRFVIMLILIENDS